MSFICIQCGNPGFPQNVEGRRITPLAGDPALCMSCGFLATMTGNGFEHRAMTDAEWDILPRDMQREISDSREEAMERVAARRAFERDLAEHRDEYLRIMAANYLLAAYLGIKYTY